MTELVSGYLVRTTAAKHLRIHIIRPGETEPSFYVDDMNKALEFPELIKQLRIRLERANHELAVLRPGQQPEIGAGRDYIRPNKRRHVGGGNYRGD